ncbi:hypothetical protein Taro_001637 [Colocasia esculenta]|uniref:Pentatricopeptide repeat-containing protein n=1 Tax=Colocasia esculenta TaxID=4460 RepID=A0A843TGU6_COLES|nr:hypothetical protein [Colocasia esculenta]
MATVVAMSVVAHVAAASAVSDGPLRRRSPDVALLQPQRSSPPPPPLPWSPSTSSPALLGRRLRLSAADLPPSTSVASSLTAALEQAAAAIDLRAGSRLHARALRLGLLPSPDPYLSSQLLRLYATCGDLPAALSVLRSTPPATLTPFFYNVLIRAHTEAALHDVAVDLFAEMVASGLSPNEYTFPFALKSCTSLGNVGLGRQLHALLVKTELLDSNVFSACALLDAYAKWGSLGDARKLFDRMPQRNDVAWNAVIAAYAQNGHWAESLSMLQLLEEEQGFEVDVTSWNSVIAGCVRCRDADSALATLGMMVHAGVRPSVTTINTLLPIIPTLGSPKKVKELHGMTLRYGGVIKMESVDDERLRCALAAGYAYNGQMDCASHLFEMIEFRTFQLWLSMMSGHIDRGVTHRAFDVFRSMAVQCNKEGRTISKVCLTLLLPECSPLSKSGMEIHAYAYRHGLESYTSLCNALIAMYAKRGDVLASKQVFQRTNEKDVITWNTMVSCYAFALDFNAAFELFHQMLSEGQNPDEYSFGSVLDGCGHLSSLQQGMTLHADIIKRGFSQSYCVIQNALIDMYGKCGCVQDARKLFDEIELKDIISWNTIISCYGFNARPYEAYLLFKMMLEEGWKPNRVTFIGLLTACSHAGLLDEGLKYFEAMSSEHGIVPDVDHYTCIVDNLGRAGQLDRAYRLIKSMPVKPDDCIWGALLGGCKIHGNVKLAEIAAKHLIELEPNHPGYKVLMSNIYADASRWNDVARVRGDMQDSGLKKFPGYSWIEVGGGELHRFFRADQSHKECTEIYSALDGLTKQLRDEGYVPCMDSKSRFLLIDEN